ncbi:MAG: caspase family protein [Kofleriaceae bacterium]
MIRLIVLACLVGWSAHAAAETRRVAVVVGNNAGNLAQPPLRYAEIDAGKISRVLVELGGVPAGDLFLLQGKNLAALEDTLRRAKAKIAGYQRALDRVVVIFYYSGHSDGVALELGRDRYTFGALRQWLKDTGADVRLGLVDSCKSGALLATKGGTPGPAFHIRLTDELASSGEALLTSSAADENALESREIGGSFFTHHLVSGMRGAADTSGDARVTLTEAYQYAYKHTLSTSGATLAGPQHPTYDYRLTGQGELILTELARPTAGIALPDGFDRALVIDLARDQVIAELGRGDPTHVALVPGRYGVRAWRGNDTFELKVVLATSEMRAVRWQELQSITLGVSRTKGEVEVSPARLAYSLEGGVRAGVATQLDALGSVRAGVRSSVATGPTLTLDVGTRSAGELRETTVFGFAGYRFGRDLGRLRASIGLELGAGLVVQSLDKTATTGALAAGPVAGLAVAITPGFAIAIEAQMPATLMKRDGELAIVALPGAWLGVIVRP